VSCPFTHDAGAYVLGALSPAERLDFEKHLAGCDACARAVGELAGLPGLLGRLDVSVLDESRDDEPVPATLLPALTRAARARRRRALVVAVGMAAAVGAVIVAFALGKAGDGGEEPPTEPGSGTPSGVIAREMDPVGSVPVQATLTLEPVAWGTRLGVTCTYSSDASQYQPPASMRYVLFVRTRDGVAERVGSWRSDEGTTMRLFTGTAEALDDIASVEVRTLEGRVVLRLRT